MWYFLAFPLKGARTLEKWPVLGQEKGREEMSLEHHVMPNSKEVLEIKRDGSLSEGHRANFKGSH